jgi:zinc/manganese transport system substrate-binding protein
MRKMLFTHLVQAIVMTGALSAHAQQATALRVVTTLPDYAFFARAIGGDQVTVKAIVRGDQDAHFIRPKPSFAIALRKADVLISTGLDLELWLQTVINSSANPRIYSGKTGYVSAAHGMTLLERPTMMSRAEGGLHIYGNPHITCSPVLMKRAARNIADGLAKNDAPNRAFYMQKLKELQQEIDERLFGPDLVKILGGDTLCDLAQRDQLIPFLREQSFADKPLIEYLGGWCKAMLPLRGTSIVTYHKNWVYFIKLFGLFEAGTVEPKPGIPPSPRHVTSLIESMKKNKIKIVLAANYFDQQKVRSVAARVDAEAVIVPMYVGGGDNTESYFELFDHWVHCLVTAAGKKGLVTLDLN